MGRNVWGMWARGNRVAALVMLTVLSLLGGTLAMASPASAALIPKVSASAVDVNPRMGDTLVVRATALNILEPNFAVSLGNTVLATAFTGDNAVTINVPLTKVPLGPVTLTVQATGESGDGASTPLAITKRKIPSNVQPVATSGAWSRPYVARITPDFATNVTPTGTVTLNVVGAGLTFTRAVRADRTVEIPTDNLAPGPHEIRVSYTGDGNWAEETTKSLGTYTVNRVLTATTLTPLNAEVLAGAPFPVTVVSWATDGGIADPANMAVSIYAKNATTAETVVTTGTATPAGTKFDLAGFTNNRSGVWTLRAVTDGNTNFAPSVSKDLTVRILPRNGTTTTLSIAPKPHAVVGAPKLVATARVEVNDGSAANGSVTFYIDGGEPALVEGVASAPVQVRDGVATLDLPGAPGDEPHNVYAVFAGNGQLGSRSLVELYEITKAGTEVILPSKSHMSADQAVPVEVRASGSDVAPTGEVEVTESPFPAGDEGRLAGAEPRGRVTLSQGAGEFPLAGFAPGPHLLKFEYTGDANNESSFAKLELLVIVRDTETTLTIDHLTAPVGSTSPPVASVLVEDVTTLAPIGDVEVRVDGELVPSQRVDGAVTARLPVGAVGTHEVVAKFLGSGSYEPSEATGSYTVTQTVTELTVTPPDAPVTPDKSIAVTVATPGSTVALEGGVKVTGDGVDEAVALDDRGVGELPLADLAPGSHELTFRYAGGARTVESTKTITVEVEEPDTTPDTTTSLVLDRTSTVVDGARVTATATVSVAGGETPQGDLTVYVDGARVATRSEYAPLRVVLPTSKVGDFEVTAEFVGSGAQERSEADPVSYRVAKADTKTAVTEPSGPIGAGDGVSVRVSAVDSIVVPTGEVHVTGAGVDETITLSAGAAELAGGALSPGSHELEFTYVGGEKTNPSSDGVTIVVEVPPGTSQTTTTLTLDDDEAVVEGDAITATAEVRVEGGASPAGALRVWVDGSEVATADAGNGPLDVDLPVEVVDDAHVVLASFTPSGAGQASSDASASYAVVKAATTTEVEVPAPPVTEDESVSVSVTAPGSSVALEGGVLVSGAGVSELVALTDGVGELELAGLAPGSHELVFTYEGGERTKASSDVVTIDIEIPAGVARTTTTLALDAESTTVDGDPVSATAQVSVEDGSVPAGTLSVSVDGKEVASREAADGSLSVELPTDVIDDAHRVLAFFTPSGAQQASSEASGSYAVVKAGTSTTVDEPTGPVSTEDSLTVRVAVAGSAAGPDGNVRVTGSGVDDTIGLTGGVGTFHLSQLAPGAHTLRFEYLAGPRTNGSSDTLAFTLETPLPATTTTLELDGGSTPVQGAAIRATAAATTGSGSALVGTMTFWVDDARLASVETEGGPVTVDLPNDVVKADHAVLAVFNPREAQHASSVSDPRTYAVVEADTTTTVTPPAGPVGTDESVLVSVTAVASSVPLEGRVRVTGEGVDQYLLLDEHGVGESVVPPLSPGEHELRFEYVGSPRTKSSSDTVTVVVKQTAGSAETSVGLVLDRETVPVEGPKVVATATVGVPAGASASGRVAFVVDGWIKLVPVEDSKAVLELPVDKLGVVPVEAVYLGTETLNSSSSEKKSYAVTKAETQVAVTLPEAPVTSEKSVGVKVTASGSAVVPSGGVTVREGEKDLATLSLVEGVGSLPLAGLVAGSHVLDFVYAGDARTAGQSAQVTVVVEKAVSTTTLSLDRVATKAHGAAVVATASVKVAGAGAGPVPDGKVEVLVDGVVHHSVAAGAVPVKVALPVGRVGTHTVLVRYLGSASQGVSQSTPATYTVAKATSNVTAAFKRLKRGRLKVTATVSSTKVEAGTVQVVAAVKVKKGKKVRTKLKVIGVATIKQVGKAVRVTIKTKALKKGRQKITVRYLGTATVLASARTYTVKVR